MSSDNSREGKVIRGSVGKPEGGLRLSRVTHSGGFVEQELEGAVCGLGGFELRVTQ